MLIRYSFIFFAWVSFNLFALEHGKPVSPQMPLVSIHFDNGYICSGAYLNSTTIVTSAHCLDGFQVRTIKDAKDLVINVQVKQQMKHPQFEWSFLWSAHDIGVIKTSNVPREYYYPSLGDKNESSVYIAACGKREAKGNRDGCTFGKNRGVQLWRYYISIGEVNVLSNDSGGIVLDPTAKKVLGVIWGWNNTIGLHFNFSSSFSEKSNREFIKKHL